MEIISRRDDRSNIFIANFQDGYVVGWKMVLPEAFKEALDIRLTPRTALGKTELVWTQGKIYDFHEGDTFHDSKLAYENWGKALKTMTLSIQIQTTSSSGYVNQETIETLEKELVVVIQKGKSKPKEQIIDGLVLKKQRLSYGTIRFRVYRPNIDRTEVEECELIECTQDEFVAFLQSGVIRTKNSETLNLFDSN